MYFSKRSFLLGLGIGIMTISLFSVVSYSKASSGSVEKLVELTDEQIIEKATVLGLVPTDNSNEKDKLISELSTKVKGLEKENVENINKNKELNFKFEEAKKEFEKQLIAAKKVTESKAEVKEETNEEVTYKSVRIPSGSSSEKVAKILYSAGVVDSSDKFNKYIQTQGKARKLRAGTFKVPTNSTYSKVLAAVLNR